MIIFIKRKIINTYLKDTSFFARYKMREIKQINIKNRIYYFYNDIIDLENFDAKLIKIDKKSYKNIYDNEYITTKKIDDCKNIHRVNPLQLIIAHANGYIEEKSVDKYFAFDSTDKNYCY